MNKEIADKWVAALRSGQYKQGRKYLRCGNQYCCLGVLCEVVGVIPTKEIVTDLPGTEFVYDGKKHSLSTGVLQKTAMADDQGCLPDGRYLSRLNDLGLTFDQIADLIEQHWEQL